MGSADFNRQLNFNCYSVKDCPKLFHFSIEVKRRIRKIFCNFYYTIYSCFFYMVY